MRNKTHIFLIVLLVISFALRIWRIDYPHAAVFDEVYYPYTAQQYLHGNKDAWTYISKPPKGHSYAWVNPPLPQEIMAISMKIFHTEDFWASRIPSVILGTLAVYLVYTLGQLLFRNIRLSLIAAFLFSIDGLNFVQSRTAMLDIYLVTFILLSLVFFLKKRFFLSAIFLGFTLGSKWSGVYLLFPIGLLFYAQGQMRKIISFTAVSLLVYLSVYVPFFLTGHSLKEFSGLLYQQVAYHLNLKATHDYASAWWSWPLNLYPVWYFVEYKGSLIANIFASGNLLLFWLGSASILLAMYEIIKRKNISLFIVLIGFFIFWLPWIASPRIMFLYYFAPSVPFMALSLGFFIDKFLSIKKYKIFVKVTLILISVNFIAFYPILTGVFLPKNIVQLFFLTDLSKNPFK